LIIKLWHSHLLLIIYDLLGLCLLSYQEVRRIFLNLLIIILRVTWLSWNVLILLSNSRLILPSNIQNCRCLMRWEHIEILYRILLLLHRHLIISLLLHHVQLLRRLGLEVLLLETSSLKIVTQTHRVLCINLVIHLVPDLLILHIVAFLTFYSA
jgi:hypothetical protein